MNNCTYNQINMTFVLCSCSYTSTRGCRHVLSPTRKETSYSDQTRDLFNILPMKLNTFLSPLRLDSTNKLEHWYARHNNVYCLHLWATCFNLYTGHLQALLYMRVHKKLCTVGSHRVNKFKAH